MLPEVIRYYFRKSSLVLKSQVVWLRIRPPPHPPIGAARVKHFLMGEIQTGGGGPLFVVGFFKRYLGKFICG